ncbi:MAG TPA: hypothetical protein PK400_07285, partial [Phycisphaerales bacterium]|nr:hypothetical protein [Phycisphaerales bacterium]
SFSSSAAAAVIQYTSKAEWQAVVGSYSTIDFTGFAHGTPLHSQYTEQYGITFDVTMNNIVHTSSFPNDGQGVRGQPGSRFYFETPQKWIAVDFVGNIRIRLLYQGEIIYTSSEYSGSLSAFAGIKSDYLFDEVYMFRNSGSPTFYDDLYGVPSPGALGVFSLAAFGCRRRRRS